MKLFPLGFLLLSTAMAAEPTKKETLWFTGEVQYEGFPLLLRFPEKPDFDSLQKKHPQLIIIRHTLEKVKSSGLPEPDYNDSLAELDQALLTAFPTGVPVLVETFGGRRNYYIYTVADAKIEEVKQTFATNFPAAKLEWKVKDDPSWQFIRRYSDEYAFYQKG